MSRTWVDAIAECEAEHGVATAKRMAGLFLDSSRTQLQTIDAAVAQNSLATARAAAHDLAAAAGALRFMQLSQVAEEFETACANGDHATVVRLHKDLAPLVKLNVVQLRAHYKL